MTVTLGDIAARLGVSAATVSRALNGRGGVSPELQDEIQRTADEAGYVTPAARRSVPAEQTTTAPIIGVIVPELENPVFPAFASVMTTMLVEQGFLPMLCSQSVPGVSEDTWLSLLASHGAKGVIVVSGMHADTHTDTARYDRLRDAGMALVLVNGQRPDLNAAFISVDDAAAVNIAVDHLVSLGHRRIGLALGPERYTPVIRKASGFARALARHAGAIDPEPLVTHSLFSLEGGVVSADELLDRGATAIVCASDMMALGAIRAAHARGLEVPRDLSVVGFDDSHFSAHVDPALTTVRQPIRTMATTAVRALLEELRNGVQAGGELLFAPELVVRGSTSAPARTPRTPDQKEGLFIAGAH
ncbi:MAG: LacI family DNA-binding transcriptional regulator [Naasia sp.]